MPFDRLVSACAVSRTLTLKWHTALVEQALDLVDSFEAREGALFLTKGDLPRVGDDGRATERAVLAVQQVGLYMILLSPILYGVWHSEGAVGGHTLRNGRANVLQ